MDIISYITKRFDHNRYSAVALLLILGGGIWLYGCQATVLSPATGESVTRTQLNAEATEVNAEIERRVEVFSASIDQQVRAFDAETTAYAESQGALFDAAHHDLDYQNEVRAKVFAAIGPAANAAMASLGLPIGVASILTAMGVGADNVRKNGIIKRLKSEADAA